MVQLRMKIFIGWGVTGLLLLPLVLRAEAEVKENPDAVAWANTEEITGAKPGGFFLEEMKKFLGLSVYLQAGYTYNFRNPASETNRQRIFDQQADTLLLDLAQVQFLRDAPVGGLGYKLKLSAGETARYIHSAGLGHADDEFDLTEAYLDYVAPLGSGIKLRLGKFVSYLGAEVIEAKDNYNYSRSFLFNYAVPFTHTGVMAGYKFSDAFTANLFLVNGWDVTDDNNQGKTLGASFLVTPIESLQLNFNFMYGPEQADNSTHYRFLLDWVGAFKVTQKMTLMANVDYAHERKDPLNGGADSQWYGAAVYAKYEFTPFFAAAVRGEYFNDPDGVRTGIRQELKEITVTADFIPVKNLVFRPEYRHDWSDQRAFDARHVNFDRKNQDTLSLSAMYTW